MIHYQGKRFRPVSNTENGEVSTDTLFEYQQSGQILTCTYQGNDIITGHLIGIVDDQGRIDMRYHHVNRRLEIMTGICASTPEILPDGRIRLHEEWQWTSGDGSNGYSVLEEI